jgi:hypothetical protein
MDNNHCHRVTIQLQLINIIIIFCTTPSFSAITGNFYPSLYNDNAAVHLGFRACLNIVAISCDITFTTVTVILDFTAFNSSRWWTSNHVAVYSFLIHLICHINSENLHLFKAEVRFSTLHMFSKVSSWFFRTTFTRFTIPEKNFHLFLW